MWAASSSGARARPSTGSSSSRASREARPGCDDPELRLVHAPDLVRVGMDVDERPSRPGRDDRRVAGRLDVPQAPADHEEHVGLPEAGEEGRIGSEPEVPRVAARVVVDVVLAAPCRRDGDAAGLAPRRERLSGGRAPRLPADDRKGTLGRGEEGPEAVEVGPGRRGLRCGIRGRVGDVGRLREHVLGQRQHDGARTARRRDPERARDELGDALGVIDLRDPLRQRPEHAPVVDLLERLPLGVPARDLPHEEHERRSVLEGRVDADGRLRRSRTARDEADPGPSRELPVRLGHVRRARLVPARDVADGAVEQAVQDVDVALAGYPEREVDAVKRELVDEDPAAGAAHRGSAIACSRRTDADCFTSTPSVGSRYRIVRLPAHSAGSTSARTKEVSRCADARATTGSGPLSNQAPPGP